MANQANPHSLITKNDNYERSMISLMLRVLTFSAFFLNPAISNSYMRSNFDLLLLRILHKFRMGQLSVKIWPRERRFLNFTFIQERRTRIPATAGMMQKLLKASGLTNFNMRTNAAMRRAKRTPLMISQGIRKAADFFLTPWTAKE